MGMTYEVLHEVNIEALRELCNDLMKFQKTKALITPERFDTMTFETRLLPSVKGAMINHILIAKADDRIVAYAYTNINSKFSYAEGPFGKFFEMDTVKGDRVGCLSQFYIVPEYRGKGIGSALFDRSMAWLGDFPEIEDYFIFVSNGNTDALNFYLKKGFLISHEILDGFITVMRNK